MFIKLQARGFSRRSAIVGQSASDSQTIATNGFVLCIGALLKRAFHWTNPASLLFQFLFGMPIRFRDRLSCFTQVMEVALLVRNIR